jgi:D-alanyl-D-alanine carboxypeptidase
MEAYSAALMRIAEIQQRVAPPRQSINVVDNSFDSAYASALGTMTATGSISATKLTPGAYGPLTPPAELVRFGNGRIPKEMLEEVGIGSHRLQTDAAQAFKLMRAAAAADGVDIDITDSYRSYDAQVDLAERKGLHKHGGLAATPGTSNHGWGLSIDVDVDAKGQAWLDQNAARYGFVEDVTREPWHWTFRPDNR